MTMNIYYLESKPMYMTLNLYYKSLNYGALYIYAPYDLPTTYTHFPNPTPIISCTSYTFLYRSSYTY